MVADNAEFKFESLLFRTTANRWRYRVPEKIALVLIAIILVAQVAKGQDDAEDTRAGLIAKAQADKSKSLKPYEPNRVEKALTTAEQMLLTGGVRWHPFFENAYAGGGFTVGAGYRPYVGAYETIDLRGSITFSGYKRLEAEYLAPRLFNRRGSLSLIGGWREATSVGFYGIGTGNTSVDDRVNYSFRQPYANATFLFRPARRFLILGAGLELTKWEQRAGSGGFPSVEEVYTPATLAGLGASPTYIHSQGTVALDWRTTPGFSRKGGYYGITAHNFDHTDDIYSFRRLDYEAIQHVPILRETWILSFRARAETTYTPSGQVIPFFMLPALGSGSTLRGFQSWRFRDQNSLLFQAEWRTQVNRFLEMAVFYDAGKVTARRSDLNFSDLKSDVGFGFRFHGPLSTPMRVEIARSNEGFAVVFGASATF